jgi:hypothetical protein
MAHQVRKPQGLTTTLSRVSPPAREVLAQEVARSGCQFPHGKSPSRRDPAASMASLCCRPGQRSSTTWRPATELAIDSPDSIFAGQLPWEHRDPLDRMLVAQATRPSLTIATRNKEITSRSPHSNAESLSRSTDVSTLL